MSDVRELLARQAEWQRRRKDLSWPDKIRMAEAVRESVVKLRRAALRRGLGQPPRGRVSGTD